MLRRNLPVGRKKAIKRVLLSRRQKATGPDPATVEQVYERAGYACEIGGCMVGDRRGVDHHIHHRRPRALGGTTRPETNGPQNLLLLCPACHLEVEQHREQARAMGWLVGQNQDPAQVPVLVHPARWVLLAADGTYAEATP